jgi:hypothetical protein
VVVRESLQVPAADIGPYVANVAYPLKLGLARQILLSPILFTLLSWRMRSPSFRRAG